MQAEIEDGDKLKDFQVKAAVARRIMVEVLSHAGCGHPGGAFSCIDLLVALFFGFLQIDPQRPDWDERDRFILSKGHASVALYTVLYMKGFFNHDALLTFRQNGSRFCGHPDMRKVSGVEMNTGSLGHGLSVGTGLAMAAKLDRRTFRTVVLLGDGESQEGSIWEAAMSAGHYRLDNLIGIIDRNRIQIDGHTEDLMCLEPFKEKWEAFGWETCEIDGHNFDEILSTLHTISLAPNRPTMIIARTIKGKGISFMENQNEWHGRPLSGTFSETAKEEVDRKYRELI